MRTLLLMSLTLVVCSGALASENEIRKYRIPAQEAVHLKGINQWLDKNINEHDCPDRDYFGLVDIESRQSLVGYEVLAECPHAPVSELPLYFDANQNYIEHDHRFY